MQIELPLTKSSHANLQFFCEIVFVILRISDWSQLNVRSMHWKNSSFVQILCTQKILFCTSLEHLFCQIENIA